MVGTAGNGQEALEKALELKPDVVLMDISMPVLNGLEASSRFRDEQPDVKVLILSMHDNREYIVKDDSERCGWLCNERRVLR